ncbi:MAG: hypothetical protein ACR2K5_00945 [Pseudolabrys sp.]
MSAGDLIFVAIERARVLGGAGHSVEGRVYRIREDGALQPINGLELIELHRRFPNFVRSWKLPEEY